MAADREPTAASVHRMSAELRESIIAGLIVLGAGAIILSALVAAGVLSVQVAFGW